MPVSFHPYLEDSRKTEVHFCTCIVLLITQKSLSSYLSSFLLASCTGNLNELFPEAETQVGYCGAEFLSKEPWLMPIDIQSLSINDIT